MRDEQQKEREILMTMRKVLAQIVKDTTPPSKSMKHPLSERTIEDVRRCFNLISLRERELAGQAGAVEERPHYADEKPAAEVVSISRLKRDTPTEGS